MENLEQRKIQQKSKTIRFYKIRKVLLIASIALSALFIFLFLINQLTIFGFGISGSTEPVGTNRICGEKDIKEYDSILADRKNALDGSEDRFLNYAKSIESKPDYKRDPNCLYLLIKQNIESKKYSAAFFLIEDLKSLLDKGGFVDSRYQTVEGIADLRTWVNYSRSLEQSLQGEF